MRRIDGRFARNGKKPGPKPKAKRMASHPKIDPEQTYYLSEVSEALRVPYRTLLDYVHDGAFAARKIGRRYIVYGACVIAFLTLLRRVNRDPVVSPLATDGAADSDGESASP